jgi:hypothetical protein
VTGRRIENLEQLRKIGFAANRRLLDVQRIGHDCFICEACFQASCSTAGENAQPIDPRTNHLRPTSTAPHGLIERIPKTHRYRITAKGLRTSIFYTRLYNRSLRTWLALISPSVAHPKLPMAKSIRAAETAVNNWYQNEKLAA